MCGIAGFNWGDKKLIASMNSAQAYRGPDSGSVYADAQVSLGHRRLAIIDLSAEANQPMQYGHYSIVFNGEIYNFQQVKDELLAKNHQFTTQSDTEVLLHAYAEWGRDFVKKLNGMWAFCIYDRQNNRLFLSRDRFGIKPLYYFFDGEKFIFASEIKAIKQHTLSLSIDKQALNFYFYQKYIGGKRTIYKEIQELPPAYSLEFLFGAKKLELFEHYNLESEIKKAAQIPLEQRKIQIIDLLNNAIEKRLLSDVPVGSFLSGGIDSSYISSIIAKKHPQFDVFTIGFTESSFNELEYAQLVAQHLQVKQHSELLDIDEKLIFKVIEQLNEPFGDPSLIPTFLLSRMTRKQVTVALSGDAGDELFGGYDTYKAYKYAKFVPYWSIKILRKLTRFIPGSDKNLHFSYKLKKFFDDFDKNINRRHLNWMSQTNTKTRKKLLKNNYRELPISDSGNDLLSLQLNDFRNYLRNDILKKTDIASMLNSLEVRVPFLDHRLVPLVLSLPERLKIKGFETKYFLKENSKKLLPPVIKGRKKQGFSVPLSLWFKKSEKMRAVISDKPYFAHNFINRNFVLELLDEHLKGKNDNSRVLWLTFIFNLWYLKNHKDEKEA